ncbi:uncharacterized protein J8A68_001478 [[Candida] subhashii]|uniref:Uncharacterized protein n=1 Tax=[Candida] subhashii TaxID=561895 RepID=A0A8J5UK12_9ASCO|nr:uncharacterized protein J8A68_001478 [[Candida] subhashii]KAG7665013.1 hypothetical protein J8A68_001478 [[Candida] subhashii]
MSTYNNYPSYDSNLTITHTWTTNYLPYQTLETRIHHDFIKLISLTNDGYPISDPTTDTSMLFEELSGILRRLRASSMSNNKQHEQSIINYFTNHGFESLITELICPMIEDMKEVERDWKRLIGVIEVIYESSTGLGVEVCPRATVELLKVFAGVKMKSFENDSTNVVVDDDDDDDDDDGWNVYGGGNGDLPYLRKFSDSIVLSKVKRTNTDKDEEKMIVGSSSGSGHIGYKYANNAIRIILTRADPSPQLFELVETWLCQAPTRSEVGNCVLYFSDLSINLKKSIETQGPLDEEANSSIKESYLFFIKTIRDCSFKVLQWFSYKQIKKDYCEIFGGLVDDSEVMQTTVIHNSDFNVYKEGDDPSKNNYRYHLPESKQEEDIPKWIKKMGFNEDDALDTTNEFEDERESFSRYPSETPLLGETVSMEEDIPCIEMKNSKFRNPLKELFKRRNEEHHHHHHNWKFWKRHRN